MNSKRTNGISAKNSAYVSQDKKSTKPQVTTPIADPQHPAAQAPKGVNLVKAQQHLDTKLPKHTGKTLRWNPVTQNLTRKKYRFEGLIPKVNPSRAWVADVREQAKSMQDHFNGANFKAACQYFELEKLPDTKITQEQLKVVVKTRTKFEAFQTWEGKNAEMKEAKASFETAKQEIQAAEAKVREQALQRQNEMADVRRQGRDALSHGDSLKGQTAAAETAKRLKAAAMKPQTQPSVTEVSPQERQGAVGRSDKLGKLQALKQKAQHNLGKGLKKTVKKKEKHKLADPSQAKRATASAKAVAKKPVLSLDRAALSQWVLEEAERLEMHPNELIEQWLIDQPVGAYLSGEQFAALRSLYVQWGNQHLQHVHAELMKQLDPLRDELNQRIAVQNEAARIYQNLPDPG
jgi:hypothetical protein